MDTKFTTRKQIYEDPSGVYNLSLHRRVEQEMPPRVDGETLSLAHRGMGLFTPEFRAAILEETREGYWAPVTKVSPKEAERLAIERSDLARAATGEGRPCPVCKGAGFLYAIHVGEKRGIRVNYGKYCSCNFWSQYWREMRRMTSSRFLGVSLQSLKPVGPRLGTEQQEQIISTVKKNSKKSFLLVGPAGRGKTHIATALFSHALERSIWEQLRFNGGATYKTCVWRAEAGLLISRTIDFDKRDMEKDTRTPVPLVRVIDIEMLPEGVRPVLVLDEVDKVAKSAYHLNVLLKLVDTVYERHGQIIMTSNTCPVIMRQGTS